MATDIINVVIDERKQLESVDNEALMNMGRQFASTGSKRSNVFKNYIVAADPFYIDNTLN
jgi:hypothetical protein